MKHIAVAAGILILLLLTAGCTARYHQPVPGTPIPTQVTPAATPDDPVLPATTLPVTTTPTVRHPPAVPTELRPSATPDETLASYLLMDSVSIIPEEVVSFHIFNQGPGEVTCTTQDPSFAVFPKLESGAWSAAALTAVTSNRPERLVMDVGDSTREYNFVAAGYRPGQYQLVTNCNANGRMLFREFTVQQKPTVLKF